MAHAAASVRRHDATVPALLATYGVDLIAQASLQRGLDPAISQHSETLLSTARLKRIGTSTQIIPLGRWGGQLGTLALTDIWATFQGMKPLVVALTQTAPEEYDRLAMQLEQEVEQYHTTFTFHLAYGQHQ